jgi:hypothetical protein
VPTPRNFYEISNLTNETQNATRLSHILNQ